MNEQEFLLGYYKKCSDFLLDVNVFKEISSAKELILNTNSTGKKLIFAGNGASASIANHASLDFTKQGMIKSVNFNESSFITAFANDYGYENVFAREIQSIATPADVLIAITTSGNSENILKALQAAKENNVPTVVLTGAGMGQLPKDVQALHMPSSDTARIQECHILIGHIICGLVEADIFSDMRSEI